MVVLTDYVADARVRREAEALVDRGDTVHVICPPLGSSFEKRSLEGVLLYPTRALRYSGDNRVLYVLQYLAFVTAAAFAVSRLHWKHRYDIVQVHTMPDFLVFSAVIPKLTGAKIILDVHDLMPELYASKFGVPHSHWLIRLLRWTERRSIAFADRAIAVHRPHVEALTAHGNPESSFTVLMNVPDPKLFSARVKRSPPAAPTFALIYHGTVTARHGLDVAAHALALARTELEDVRLRLVGVGEGVSEFEELVRDLGLSSHVEVTRGPVPIEDLVPLIASSSAGIVPIRDDPFTRYMLPVKLLEYVALRLPTICARTATIQEYFDEEMLCFFTPGNAEDLASKIVELAQNPDRAERFATNATAFTDRYGWETQKALYYDLIDSLMMQSKDAAERPGGQFANEPDRARDGGARG